MQKIRQISTVMLVSLTLSNAYAVTLGAYFGAGVGFGNLTNFQDAKKIEDSGGLSSKIFFGYNVTKNIGLEVDYAQYAKATYRFLNYNVKLINYQLTIASLVSKLYVPFGSAEVTPFHLYLLVGFGLAHMSTDIEYNDKKGNPDSNTATIFVGGFGGSYRMSKHVVLSLEFSGAQGQSGEMHIGIPYSNLTTLNLALIG